MILSSKSQMRNAFIPPCRDSKSFTLVELLVVTAIIAVLISILLPALTGAREQAKSVYCLNNLRQMVPAAHAYAQSYADHYPIAYYMEDPILTRPLLVTHAWDFTITSRGRTIISVRPGNLWEGLPADRIHQCPVYSGPANWLGDPFTGYNYNISYIGHGDPDGKGSVVPPSRITDPADPVRTALFGDGEYYGGADKFMRAPFANPGDVNFIGRSGGTQGFRHRRQTNVAWADGHAAVHADRFTTTYDFDAPNIAPDTGFLSPDNSLYDLQ
jgi:prepilin-type processing-associated H-X9-DG protein